MLVLLSKGKPTATRFGLARTLVVIGQTTDCDIHLKGRGVEARHCLLFQDADGLRVRDLGSAGGVRVNGQRIREAAICDGDTLQVGAVHLRLELAVHGLDSQALRDALRIQAAAVAAQQTALLEEEIRLQQRLSALAQQEKQLSTHLEEKRRKLIVLQEKAQAERTAQLNERTAYEQFVNRVQGDLTHAQRDLVDSQQRVQKERRRLSDLQRKLRQRWHRHWHAENQKLLLRQEEMANEECNLAKEGEQLQKQRESLASDRLRFNGEYELGRCQLRQAWKRLRDAQQQWRTRRRQERSALRLQRQELSATENRLLDTQNSVAQEQTQWSQAREKLEKEIEGLNNRIRHQRDVIFQNQQDIARIDGLLRARKQLRTDPGPSLSDAGIGDKIAPAAEGDTARTSISSENEEPREQPALAANVDSAASASEAAVPDDSLAARLAHLEHLAGDLADQRAQLLEQWQKLAGLQQHWERDREQAAGELEAAAQQLQEQETNLTQKEQNLRSVAESLRKKHRELLQLRQHMVGFRARLRAREMGWEKERNQKLIEIRHREELIKHHFKSLGEIRRRWAVNRRLEVEKLRAERIATESLRKDYAELRQEWQRRCTVLDQEKRLLAEKNLALEQFRQEVLNQSDNAPAADRRVERLRRRWVTQNAHAIRALARDREALKAEMADLEARFAEVQKQAEDVTAAENTFLDKKIAWEHKQALLAAERARLKQELKIARAQSAASEQQLVLMTDEIERIARALLDEPDPPALQAEQAA